jgi:tetratricopeptide (TPR) repeat protein
MSLRLLWVGCLAAVCFLGFVERPALADDAVRAKELYRKGKAHFAVGEYEAAGEAYQSAYKLKPDPALLYNAAQAYRLAGKLDHALTLYRNYLRFHPDASNAGSVNGQIAKLEKQIEAERTAAAKPAPPPPPAPSLPPALPSPASPEPPAALTASGPPSEPGERPVYRRPWFWGVVGGVAAVAVVTAVVVSSSAGGSWNNLPEVRELRSAALVRW